MRIFKSTTLILRTRRLHIENGHRYYVIVRHQCTATPPRVPGIYFRVDKSPSFRDRRNLWANLYGAMPMTRIGAHWDQF